MKRSLAALLALLAAGCGSNGSGSSAPALPDASRVDMCTVLTDAELSQLGINLNTRKQVNELGSVGCQWVGNPITLDLERDKENLASYQARRHSPTFTSFVENMVNGRAGAHLSVRRDRTDCAQLIDGGPVSLSVAVAPAFSLNGPKIDSCAEALRIAQMIEPRLPRAGS